MASDDPVVIVGAGLAGAGAAWALARRSVPVMVLEQYAPGHVHGGSHGSARIVRRAYGDPFYTALTGRAYELWDEVQPAASAELVRWTGALDFGTRRDVPGLAATLAAAGVRHEVLDAAAAARRWPGMRFDGDVLFHADAGVLDADAAVTALLGLAHAAGAQVRYESAVTALEPGRVRLTDGTVVAARCVVLAAGGWIGDLLGPSVGLPPIRVTRQSVFHFPRRDPDADAWPSTIHELDQGAGYDAVYHLAGGRDGGARDDRKIGLHDAGPVVRAGDRRAVDAGAREFLLDYVRNHLPGLDPEPRSETTCLYTSTPTQDFLLDRVGDVVVCSPCSGHGAKFAPLVGEWVADLVTGAGVPVPGRFRLAAHAAARAGHVSL